MSEYLDKIITKDRLESLKNRVKAECLRRSYTGASGDKGKPVNQYGSSTWNFQNSPTKDNEILSEQYEKISIPLRKINDLKINNLEIPNGPFNRIVNDDDLTVFETVLTALEQRSITTRTTSDCAVACTGTCTSACTTGCTGTCSSACGGNCTGGCTGCGSSCSGDCSNSCGDECTGCTQTCGASCTIYCGTGCIGHCVISCYSAGSKANEATASKAVGVTLTYSNCGDSCVDFCVKGCGDTCGGSNGGCGGNCSTYNVRVTNTLNGTGFDNKSLIANSDSTCFECSRYWYLTVTNSDVSPVYATQTYFRVGQLYKSMSTSSTSSSISYSSPAHYYTSNTEIDKKSWPKGSTSATFNKNKLFSSVSFNSLNGLTFSGAYGTSGTVTAARLYQELVSQGYIYYKNSDTFYYKFRNDDPSNLYADSITLTDNPNTQILSGVAYQNGYRYVSTTETTSSGVSVPCAIYLKSSTSGTINVDKIYLVNLLYY